MASERPNRTASGGISPSVCTKELTEFVLVMGLFAWNSPAQLAVHPESQMNGASSTELSYLIKCMKDYVLRGEWPNQRDRFWNQGNAAKA
jgi:hypothetical protein